jgi:hypothetical protein
MTLRGGGDEIIPLAEQKAVGVKDASAVSVVRIFETSWGF